MNNRKMRLCFVGNMLGRNPGYVTTQGQILSDLLAADGFEVSSVSSQINQMARLADIVHFITTNRKNIDVLILEVYSGWYLTLADAVTRLARYYELPTIAVLHGGNLPKFAARRPRWTIGVLNRANLLVAPSPYLAEAMKTFNLNVRVVPNAIALENYCFQPRRNVSPRLIWMRSFHEIYNPHLALKTLRILHQTHPQATLVMAGRDKGLEDKVKLFAREIKVEDAVWFPGFLDQKSKESEFSQADIYLNTSRIDNMPVSVVEACALGLPIISTDVGGISQLLTHGETGLLVPDNDAQKMADAVKRLLCEPDLTENLSRNGRRLAERSSWKAVRDEWEKLFLEVANKFKDVG